MHSVIASTAFTAITETFLRSDRVGNDKKDRTQGEWCLCCIILHSIVQSTVSVHFPVQQLETPKTELLKEKSSSLPYIDSYSR